MTELGPPYCDRPCPLGIEEELLAGCEGGPEPEPIRCSFKKGHDGPHGWDLKFVQWKGGTNTDQHQRVPEVDE